MADQNELLNAIGDHLLESMKAGATSDTILKLAEAWAWVHTPDEAHGGTSWG